MELLDTTLREGEQMDGVKFTLNQKIELAKMLDDFGVNIIEVGHPIVNSRVKKACHEICKIDLNAETMIHSRARKTDIDDAIECKTDWIGIFMATSKIGRDTKYGKSQEEVLEKCIESVEYAKSQGLKVRFTPEDATRTEKEYLVQICNELKKVKVDRISIADTVGMMTPTKMYDLIKFMIKETGMDFNVHCHNDLGLATANSLAAFDAGAKLSDVSVNGFGERAGITPISELALTLATQYKIENWKLELLPELSKKAAKFAGVNLSPHMPIVGENAFTHKAGLHTNAVIKNPATYETFDPAKIGVERKIIVDQFTSKKTLMHKLKELGLDTNQEEFERIYSELKESPKKWMKNEDILEIVKSKKPATILDQELPGGIMALISIKVNEDSEVRLTAKSVASLSNIEKVFEVSGGEDIIAMTKGSSVSELDEIVNKIYELPGVKDTQSKIIMREHHD